MCLSPFERCHLCSDLSMESNTLSGKAGCCAVFGNGSVLFVLCAHRVGDRDGCGCGWYTFTECEGMSAACHLGLALRHLVECHWESGFY